MKLHSKQTLLGAMPLLLALIGLMATDSGVVIANHSTPSDPTQPTSSVSFQIMVESALYKTTGSEVDLFLNPAAWEPVKGLTLARIEDEDSGEVFIRARIALFNGGENQVTIPKGVRILTLSQKGEPPGKNKQFVNVITESNYTIPGRLGQAPGFTRFTVDFDSGFLHTGLNELSYTVDPDNHIAESAYPWFEWYALLTNQIHGEDIWHKNDERAPDYITNHGYSLNKREVKHFWDTHPEFTCTVVPYLNKPKGLTRSMLDCDNGLTGWMNHSWSIGSTKIFSAGYINPTVTQFGQLIPGPAVGPANPNVPLKGSGTIKEWDDEQFYVFGEENNQGSYIQDQPIGSIKLFHPGSYPDLHITNVRFEPEIVNLVNDKVWEYIMVIEGINTGGDMVDIIEYTSCRKGGMGGGGAYHGEDQTGSGNHNLIKSGEKFEIRLVRDLSKINDGFEEVILEQIKINDRRASMSLAPPGRSFSWKKSAGGSLSANNIKLVVDKPPGSLDTDDWPIILNTHGLAQNTGLYGLLASAPLEIGSEGDPIPSQYENMGKLCFDPEFVVKPDGNSTIAEVDVVRAKPFIVSSKTEHVWQQGIYPPLFDRNYINKQGANSSVKVVGEGGICQTADSQVSTNNMSGGATKNRTISYLARSLEMWSYDCAGPWLDFFAVTPWRDNLGLTSTMLVDEQFEATEEWLKGWSDSLVKFRWIRVQYLQEPYRLQILNDAKDLIYEKVIEFQYGTPADKVNYTSGIFHADIGQYDEDIDAFYLSAAEMLPDQLSLKVEGKTSPLVSLMNGDKTNPRIYQWIYDGPPLKGGQYTFRVAYDALVGTNAPWSEELPFVIETEEMNPGDSIALRDTNLDQEIRFVGTITRMAPNGITVTTEAGASIHLYIDADTLISTKATGLEGHLIPGLKVEVTVPEVPYIAERAYIPLNRIPTASSITDFITPELIYPENGQVFDLGVYPPIQDDWASCSSQECDQAKLLTSPSLDPWKAGWIESLLRFRWLPTLTTENARFKLEVQNDSGTIVYESEFAPGLSEEGLNSTSTGVAIDETTWLGDDPTSARHYHQILAHYWIDRRATSANGQSPPKQLAIINEGKFYQYVYDGPVLMPGEYTWKIARLPETAGEPAVWSSESTFVVKANEYSLGDSPQLKDQDLAEGVTFRGEVTDVRPGGFTVTTESGVVHLQTDTTTTIFSPLTMLHNEVPLDWKVHVLSNELPYISGRAYVPNNQIPVASQVTEFVTNRKHKRCTAVGKTGAGTTAFSCDDGDYVELNDTDIPNGTNAVLLITNDSAALISTANDLHDRMKRFKTLADSQNNEMLSSQVSSYQDQAHSAFEQAFKEAMENASPEVLKLVETMGDLDDKVLALASAFLSGEEQLIFDANDMSSLADQLEEFSDTYESIIDLMVIETMSGMPQEEQDKVRTDIRNLSTQFLSDMQSDLKETADFLNQGNLQEAITVLERLTANEEQWMQQITQPRINIALASGAIEEATEELSLYGNDLSEQARSDLQQKIDALNSALIQELQQPGSLDLMPLIEDLWNTMESVWSSGGGDTEQMTYEGGSASDAILLAESELAEYADYMKKGAADNIKQKMSELQEAMANGDESLIQEAVNDLMNALSAAYDN